MFIKDQNGNGMIEVSGKLTIRAIGFNSTTYTILMETPQLREHTLGSYNSQTEAEAVLEMIADAMFHKEPLFRMPKAHE